MYFHLCCRKHKAFAYCSTQDILISCSLCCHLVQDVSLSISIQVSNNSFYEYLFKKNSIKCFEMLWKLRRLPENGHLHFPQTLYRNYWWSSKLVRWWDFSMFCLTKAGTTTTTQLILTNLLTYPPCFPVCVFLRLMIKRHWQCKVKPCKIIAIQSAVVCN